jgi:hypothetical protein
MTDAYSPSTIFRPELFPGLEIPVDTLWSQPPLSEAPGERLG